MNALNARNNGLPTTIAIQLYRPTIAAAVYQLIVVGNNARRSESIYIYALTVDNGVIGASIAIGCISHDI